MNAPGELMPRDRKSRRCCPSVGKLLEPRFFKALCEPKRIAILAHLAQRGVPLSVGQIAKSLPINISVVSRHLAILREAGVLSARKNGKEVLYSILFPQLVTTLRTMADAIEACCPPRNSHTRSQQ
jgi:DNA-binding transcriptional ArsR family regulator